MKHLRVSMGDGTAFEFWDDRTKYRRIYHVSQRHRAASDRNPGTADRPFATISRAAEVLLAGEKVVVHGGVYRELVRPNRGGDGPGRMIAYQAAPGESVTISASEVLAGPALEGRTALPHVGNGVWAFELPYGWFRGHNPFSETNLSHLSWFPWQKRTENELKRALMKRGQIFQNGRPLRQVPERKELSEPGTFWVRDPGLLVAVHLFDDADPASVKMEVSTRAQCFAPAVTGLGYIRVSGFVFEHAANGVPMPQHGTLATTGGHHWILEDNTVTNANTIGIDIGWQGDGFARPQQGEPSGGHIVRRNRVERCGVNGICGTWGTNGCLVEDNVIENIGGLRLEHCYEAAGIKLHFAHRTLVRRNVIRHMQEACGIWMDCLCAHNRLCGNVIADVTTVLAGIYVEANPDGNVVDGNVVWDVGDGPNNVPPKDGIPGGNGISVDVSDKVTVAHNLLGRIRGHYAVAIHLAQKERVTGGRTAMCRGESVLNNLFVECPKRVLFARATGNVADGNLYDGCGRGASFGVEESNRTALLNLDGWREFFGFDRRGGETEMVATFDAERLELVLTVKGPPPKVVGTKGECHLIDYVGPGPFDATTRNRLRRGKPVTIRLLERYRKCGDGTRN